MFTRISKSTLLVPTFDVGNTLKNIVLLICLVLLLVFNVENSSIRVLFVTAIIVLPIFLIWRKNLPGNFISGLCIYASFFCFFLSCILVNINTFSLIFQAHTEKYLPQ